MDHVYELMTKPRGDDLPKGTMFRFMPDAKEVNNAMRVRFPPPFVVTCVRSTCASCIGEWLRYSQKDVPLDTYSHRLGPERAQEDTVAELIGHFFLGRGQ